MPCASEVARDVLGKTIVQGFLGMAAMITMQTQTCFVTRLNPLNAGGGVHQGALYE